MSEQSPDLQIEAIRGIDKSYRDAGEITNPDIGRHVSVFVANVNRLIALGEFAPLSIGLTSDAWRGRLPQRPRYTGGPRYKPPVPQTEEEKQQRLMEEILAEIGRAHV